MNNDDLYVLSLYGGPQKKADGMMVWVWMIKAISEDCYLQPVETNNAQADSWADENKVLCWCREKQAENGFHTMMEVNTRIENTRVEEIVVEFTYHEGTLDSTDINRRIHTISNLLKAVPFQP